MVEEKATDHTAKPQRPKRSIGRRIWSVTKWFLLFVFLCGFMAAGVVTGYVASLVKNEPIRSAELIQQKVTENAITGYVYFNDGSLIGQLRTDEDRTPVRYEQIPQVVIDALVATEDSRFFEHNGIDIRGLSRAVLQKVFNSSTQTGGSTLTQQLARQVFLSLDKTDSRKAKEIFLALRIERTMSKKEILTAYLNKMHFGNGSNGYNVYGIKAAAKGIFDIDISKDELNIAQAAYLAGLPQLPSAYSAFTSKGEYNEKGIERAIERQKRVLKYMLEENKITQQQYEEALAFDIRASMAKPKKKAYSTYPYLMMEAERAAAEVMVLQKNPELTKEDLSKPENAQMLEDARQELLRGGYRIYTTIDKTVYEAMHKVSENADNFSADSEEKGIEQVAGMMIDNKTGAILGMIEGRDFYEEQMNLATQMLRQPGSTMKPLAAYLPALDKGLIQPASILDDAPIVLKDGTKGYHIPVNWNYKYKGLMTAREALAQSYNLPALKVFLEKVTINEAWEFVKKLGITTIDPDDYYSQTGVIGGLKYGVTVEEMTNAFSAIGNEGKFNDAYFVAKILDSNAQTVYLHETNSQQVVSEQSAYLMTDMLKSVVKSGTGSDIKNWFNGYGDIEVAAKTGSTQNYADTWFVGYTPDVTVGVWVGYEKQIHVLNKSARKRSTEIWAKVMNEILDMKPELLETKKFERPDGIVSMTVSGFSGKLPNDLTRASNRLVTDIFNRKFIPTETEDALVKMKYVTYDGVNYIPNAATPEDMLREQVVVKREKPIQELVEELKAALAKLSSSSTRRSLEQYMPEDANLDAPSKEDPRQDDGRAPNAPSSVAAANLSDTQLKITFAENAEKDVVGYRLYRSLNGGPYQKQASALVGDQLRFINYVSAANGYSYYVTAVDVAGNESAPSAIVSWGTNTAVPEDPGTTTPGDDNGNGSGNGDGNTDGNNPGSPVTPEPPAPTDPETPAVDNVPEAPSQLRSTLTDLGVKLTWKSSDQNTSSYNVYFSTQQQGTYERIGSSALPEFEIITLKPNGFYYVTAVNSKGESKASRIIQVGE